MILWDGFSDKRRDYYPDYKANRDEDPEMKKMKEGFAVQKPYILKMMAALGVNQLIAKDAEADDWRGCWLVVLRHNQRSIISTCSPATATGCSWFEKSQLGEPS